MKNTRLEERYENALEEIRAFLLISPWLKIDSFRIKYNLDRNFSKALLELKILKCLPERNGHLYGYKWIYTKAENEIKGQLISRIIDYIRSIKSLQFKKSKTKYNPNYKPRTIQLPVLTPIKNIGLANIESIINGYQKRAEELDVFIGSFKEEQKEISIVINKLKKDFYGATT